MRPRPMWASTSTRIRSERRRCARFTGADRDTAYDNLAVIFVVSGGVFPVFVLLEHVARQAHRHLVLVAAGLVGELVGDLPVAARQPLGVRDLRVGVRGVQGVHYGDGDLAEGDALFGDEDR